MKNYKKLYENALERARDLHDNHPYGEPGNWWTCEKIFPELKESKDERIRKCIIAVVCAAIWNSEFSTSKDECLAWLEKQGEQNLANSAKTCKDEQKPADKVEPKVFAKFKIGDWIACEELNTAKIISLDGDKYEVEFIDGNKGFPHIDYIDRNFHLWTIQDAKDGDVLALNNEYFLFKEKKNSTTECYISHCFIDSAKTFRENGEFLPIERGNKVCPTTKEQYDLLFSKMKEAGYEWDFEKKELKKIEQKDEKSKMTPFEKEVSEIIDEAIEDDKGLFNVCEKLLSLAKDEIEQKPSWSEEDDEMMKDIIDTIQSLLNTNESWSYLEDHLDWLKSLKNRVQPQQEWSENDKEQLDRAIYMMGQLGLTKSWDDVYNWLKLLENRI